MSLIAPGVKFWSWRGALHVAQSFTMFCLPGYALYKLNTSDMVRGDLEQKLPKRPDLPMGGNASNRVYSPGEQRLQDMLKKVERVSAQAARMLRVLFQLLLSALQSRLTFARRARGWSWRRHMMYPRKSGRKQGWRSTRSPILGTDIDMLRPTVSGARQLVPL